MSFTKIPKWCCGDDVFLSFPSFPLFVSPFIITTLSFKMHRFYFLVAVLLISSCLSHSEEGEDVHFYCRVCGAHITNATNIIKKDTKDIDFNSYLENQAPGVTIPYDSFTTPVNMINIYN